MKKFYSYLMCTIAAANLLAVPLPARASEETDISYDQVASEDEKSTAHEVGVEGMFPVYGADVEDGVYEAEMESSSSMFKAVSVSLTVKEGEMTAALTMSGTGYLKLFMGTGAQAAKADPSEYIGYEENEEGKHVYTIPVEALDAPIDCAAFSRNKEKWYDRSILIRADSLPEGAVKVELPDYDALEKAAKEKRIAAIKAESEEEARQENADSASNDGMAESPVSPAFIEMEDGEYAIGVELTGGSGRSTVSSPAILIVKDGLAYARIEWSSSSYDYMIVGGEKYLPVNEEGYSTFEIPILVFNEEMPIIADTTAMSTPHEVEYQLIFSADSVTSKNATPQAAARRVVYMALAIIAVCVIVPFVTKNRKKRKHAG